MASGMSMGGIGGRRERMDGGRSGRAHHSELATKEKNVVFVHECPHEHMDVNRCNMIVQEGEHTVHHEGS